MRQLIIEQGRSRQPVAPNEFPYAVGVSDFGSFIFGSVAEKRPVIWIQMHADGYAIQPERYAENLTYNGVPMSGPTWLRPGDKIMFAGECLHVDVDGDNWTLREVGAQRGPVPSSHLAAEDDGQAQRFGTKFQAQSLADNIKARRARNIVAAGLLILLLGVGYVLSASSLSLQFEPAADSISVSGGLPVFPLGDRYLAFPGDYTISAIRDGYKPLNERVSVKYGAAASYSITFQKLPGRLRVTAQPPGVANILVDGADRGLSPATIEIDAGDREVKLVSDRYLTETRKIAIEGAGALQDLEVVLKPAWGTLSIVTQPDDVKVTLDGKEIGQTPLVFEAIQGERTVELSKDGWKTATRKLDVKAGIREDVPRVDLERIDGTLELRSEPSEALVSVNGEFKGSTPQSLVLVGDRNYQLSLSKSGYETASRAVSVEGGKQARLSIQLQPEMGMVFVTTSPPGATLSVNGQPVGGGATQRLSLQTVPQTIEISRAGYESFKGIVTPQRGIPKRLDVTLKTLGEALKEKAKDAVTRGGQKLVLIHIQTPARFNVGSSRRDTARRSNEVEYPVELGRSFLISEKEVTNAEFRRFKPSHASGSYQSTSLNGPEQPVVNVSWEDAARYANWLSAQESLQAAYREEGGKMVAVMPLTNGYRLPTEAEWEFVARFDGGREPADKPLRYSWGDASPPPKESGNFAHEGSGLPFSIQGYGDAYIATAPVGKFPPNRSLIYDLSGNVAEWCHDFYDVPVASQRAVVDPAGPQAGRFHVIKGPSWRTGSTSELRLTYRDYSEKPRDDLGFRVVRYAEQP